jgi:hypothetical protein
MDLEQAILDLQDRPSFQLIEKMMSDYKETHINDLSNMANAENPQLLAYLAGGIAVLNTILSQIDECKRSDQA